MALDEARIQSCSCLIYITLGSDIQKTTMAGVHKTSFDFAYIHKWCNGCLIERVIKNFQVSL